MSDGNKALTKEVGNSSPKMNPEGELNTGDVGYIVTNIRDVSEIKLGDTITLQNNPELKSLVLRKLALWFLVEFIRSTPRL